MQVLESHRLDYALLSFLPVIFISFKTSFLIELNMPSFLSFIFIVYSFMSIDCSEGLSESSN